MRVVTLKSVRAQSAFGRPLLLEENEVWAVDIDRRRRQARGDHFFKNETEAAFLRGVRIAGTILADVHDKKTEVRRLHRLCYLQAWRYEDDSQLSGFRVDAPAERAGQRRHGVLAGRPEKRQCQKEDSQARGEVSIQKSRRREAEELTGCKIMMGLSKNSYIGTDRVAKALICGHNPDLPPKCM